MDATNYCDVRIRIRIQSEFKAFQAWLGFGFRPQKVESRFNKGGFRFIWIRIRGVWIQIWIGIRVSLVPNTLNPCLIITTESIVKCFIDYWNPAVEACTGWTVLSGQLVWQRGMLMTNNNELTDFPGFVIGLLWHLSGIQSCKHEMADKIRKQRQTKGNS